MMKYLKNITNSNVRLGRGEENRVLLEPETVVTSVDPKTRNKSTRPGQNVAEIHEDKLRNNSTGILRSEGRLYVEISEEEFTARQAVIDNWSDEHKDAPQTIPGFLSRDHEMTIDSTPVKTEEAVARFDMNPETLEMYTGAAHGTQSRPDPAEGGKTLSEVRSEGVRRSENAEPRPVDPGVVEQMGKGE
jgi:hypothetical protein